MSDGIIVELRLCVEFTVFVGTEQVIANLWQHLSHNSVRRALESAIEEHTLSSNRRNRSSRVLSTVMRPLPLMTTTPPALYQYPVQELSKSDIRGTHNSLLNEASMITFTCRPLISLYDRVALSTAFWTTPTSFCLARTVASGSRSCSKPCTMTPSKN